MQEIKKSISSTEELIIYKLFRYSSFENRNVALLDLDGFNDFFIRMTPIFNLLSVSHHVIVTLKLRIKFLRKYYTRVQTAEASGTMTSPIGSYHEAERSTKGRRWRRGLILYI